MLKTANDNKCIQTTGDKGALSLVECTGADEQLWIQSPNKQWVNRVGAECLTVPSEYSCDSPNAPKVDYCEDAKSAAFAQIFASSKILNAGVSGLIRCALR